MRFSSSWPVMCPEDVKRDQFGSALEAAGFSKAAAHQYFDGREDLLADVLDDVLDRLLGVPGPWTAEPAAIGVAPEAAPRGGSPGGDGDVAAGRAGAGTL
ncbi:TetR/AcrR family transcriptional regulator [Streptomyces xanthophaeus]|uniref:TetR/AcrR family transcriptional regulator n=1 Tax=Streptomyces xanthophaeus TaxID=67385 RepID=UPI002649ADF8|nr:TetR/AcrR family transcriptional regulator [Streptomyces xanthophaeus]WKD30948.1 TetR/AcrR family transcriptional regulator [Streptomyces xanthophaeus]